MKPFQLPGNQGRLSPVVVQVKNDQVDNFLLDPQNALVPVACAQYPQTIPPQCRASPIEAQEVVPNAEYRLSS